MYMPCDTPMHRSWSNRASRLRMFGTSWDTIQSR